MTLSETLQSLIAGEVRTDQKTLEHYATDESAFRVVPRAVVSPQSVADISALVRFVQDRHRRGDRSLSLTARSAGTDMTGGPLTESVVVDCTTHLNRILSVTDDAVTAQPGTYYRDVERETLKRNRIFPSYPASKDYAAIGGIVANNAGGEKTLAFGQTVDHVRSLKAVLADGNEYEFHRLTKTELSDKKHLSTFEGELYRTIDRLFTKHRATIAQAQPKVSKNSTGYFLWRVRGKDGSFDLGQLLIGSQGTLGIITEASLGLVPVSRHSQLAAVYLHNLDLLPAIIERLRPLQPTSLEIFDDKTIGLVLRFLPQLLRRVMATQNLLTFVMSVIPDIGILATHGIPKLTLLAEFEGDDEREISARMQKVRSVLQSLRLPFVLARSREAAKKYWTIRHESYALLRRAAGTRRAIPFIDDLIVPVAQLPTFLRQLKAILATYPQLNYSIAGHAGDGNLHVIPLMDLANPRERAMLPEIMERVYTLALSLGGSLSAEHNEGLIRSPYERKMYGDKVFALFSAVKQTFDPYGIFNPHKKTEADLHYSLRHLNMSSRPTEESR